MFALLDSKMKQCLQGDSCDPKFTKQNSYWLMLARDQWIANAFSCLQHVYWSKAYAVRKLIS